MYKTSVKKFYKKPNVKIHSSSIIKFIDEYLKIFDNNQYQKEESFNLNEQQKEYIKLMKQNPYLVCKKSRQMGASSVSVAYMLVNALLSTFNTNKTFIYLTHNTYAKKNIIRKLKKYIDQIKTIIDGSVFYNNDKFTFSNGSRIIVCTPLDIIRYRKYTDLDMYSMVESVVVDECAFIDDNIMNDLLRIFNTDYLFSNSQITFVSTPNGKNYFYYLYKLLDNKYSMTWWKDDRCNKDLLWYKDKDFLHTQDKNKYDVLYSQGWFPLNQWFINRCCTFNMNYEIINREINCMF